jgi:hypothetical protein
MQQKEANLPEYRNRIRQFSEIGQRQIDVNGISYGFSCTVSMQKVCFMFKLFVKL